MNYELALIPIALYIGLSYSLWSIFVHFGVRERINYSENDEYYPIEYFLFNLKAVLFVIFSPITIFLVLYFYILERRINK